MGFELIEVVSGKAKYLKMVALEIFMIPFRKPNDNKTLFCPSNPNCFCSVALGSPAPRYPALNCLSPRISLPREAQIIQLGETEAQQGY